MFLNSWIQPLLKEGVVRGSCLSGKGDTTIRASGGNPVLPIALAGRALEVRASLLGKLLGCVCGVREITVEKLRAELSWTSWFNSSVKIDICSFNGSKFALTLSSIKTGETPLTVSFALSKWRAAGYPRCFQRSRTFFICEL